MGFGAWGDESGSDRRRDPGTYILGAAVADEDCLDDLRQAMLDLRLASSGPKLHWRDESPSRKHQIAERIAALPVEGFVVVRQGAVEERPERRRRKCLERLLREVTSLGCQHLTLESRGQADDRRDRHLVDQLRRNRRLSNEVKVLHTPGPREPALWLADALCGAVSNDRTGQPEFLKTIAGCVTVETLEVD